MEHAAARQRLVEGLLQNVEASRHPSPQMLERVERSITSRDDAERYVDVLLSRCDVSHPSLALLDRAERVVRRIERSDELDRHLQGAHDRNGNGAEPQENDR